MASLKSEQMWCTEEIPLTGWLERQRFSPVFTALMVSLGVFVLFQLVSSIFAIVLLLFSVPLEALGEHLDMLASGEFASQLLLANSLGQIVGMALPVWWITRLHTPCRSAFLRLRRPSGALLGWSILGLIVLMPFVQWLASVNAALPLPEGLRTFDRMQMEMIEQVLKGLSGTHILYALLVLAVVPAFCEELLFRGYVQRQFERGLGIAGAILLTGVLFGIYHLRFTQVIPLAFIGVYLAYITWRTESLWPAIVNHFLNNSFAVFLALYAEQHPDLSIEDLETLSVPWYIVLLSVALGLVVIRQLHQRSLSIQPGD